MNRNGSRLLRGMKKDSRDMAEGSFLATNGHGWTRIDGVNPSGETRQKRHGYRSLKLPRLSLLSVGQSPLAGEAEASSAGEQLAEE